MENLEIDHIQQALRDIANARDWEQFHSPKNMAIATAVEAGELLEIFQWMSDEESKNISTHPKKLNQIAEEMADVFYNLIRLADVLKIDLNQAFWAKLKQLPIKYPVELSKGNATKYTELNK